MSWNKLYILSLIICLFTACQHGNEPLPVPNPVVPAKAELLFPLQNEVCATGENQTSTLSTIHFDWNDAVNAESYSLSLKNLLTGAITNFVSITSDIKITLTRATPYSWNVTSRSSKTTVAPLSNTWKFYNSGVGEVSYAPFPAMLTYPANNQIITTTNANLTLSWSGSDADNDITSYEIYYGKNSTPALISTNKPDNLTLSVDIVAGTTFYWKVITKDAKGNISDSGINQFKIN